ncbi:class I SAM-dependent methyltransferase [Mycobacterium hubeiense]|uniref:class I SAM-dependent methyltransferase n=1 Tax=Mycobacterium hubeiense TaxID=1867256 RepID=UPI000C7F4FFA|nr:class I SAM-dependent methyltransferase [Mycobacterium sp. QGD 101]
MIELDKTFWEERWRQAQGHGAVQDWPPNPQLVSEVDELTPGDALDAGCGQGTDAFWLAARGWRVTAVDFADAALRRAQANAEALDDAVAARIDWRQADLSVWTPPEEHFDLVSSHYVHGVSPRDDLFRRLASAVKRGGTLLIVGHHPLDHTTISGLSPEVYFSADDVAACLEPDSWDIVVAETRTRSATDPHGRQITLHDAVLRARRRA